MPVKLSTVGLQPSKTNTQNKNSILSPISLNTSREHIGDLFNNFKKLNNSPVLNNKPVDDSSTKLTTKTSIGSDASASNNDSIDLVKVVESEPNKLTALYVGDLDVEVTEELLYNHFKRYPSLSSVKICYFPKSRKSLGYGYVNFESETDAKKAIEDLNYSKLMSKEIRIMPSLQGKEKRILGTNVFISNLNIGPDSTVRSFYEKFRSFGDILSCKLDPKKRQGFISFADRETAEKFVEDLNDRELDGSKIYCSIHIPKQLRKGKYNPSTLSPIEKKSSIDSHSTLKSPLSPTSTTINHQKINSGETFSASSALSTWSNNLDDFKQIYVKGLPLDVTYTDILKLFSSCGKIMDLFKEVVEKYKSCWCLITYESSSSAKDAIEAYHKTMFRGKKLTCVKALKRAERKIQLGKEAASNSSSGTGTTIQDVTESKRNSSISRETSFSGKKSFKVYLENLPPGINENFFKLFLRSYSFRGKILKYSINPLSEKYRNYIEFENEEDARDVNAKINGVHIAGQTLKSRFEDTSKSIHPNQLSRSPSLRIDTPVMSFNNSSVGSPITSRSYSTQIRPNAYNTNFPENNPSSKVSLFRNGKGTLFQLVPIGNELQRVSTVAPNYNLSRTSSMKTVSNDNTRFSVPLMDKLEEVALQYIDFLVYPAATRPRNLKRILQFLVDTYWKSDFGYVSQVLQRIDEDPTLQSSFKSQLIESIEILGFSR